MLPACLLTVRIPSVTIQRAGPRSLTDTHWSRSWPSKRTMASEGGASFVRPGETTRGTGVQTVVSSGRPLAAWARREDAPKQVSAIASDVREKGKTNVLRGSSALTEKLNETEKHVARCARDDHGAAHDDALVTHP